MINREIFADLGTRMNIDTRLRVGLLCDDTRNHRHIQLVQLVGDAIMRHRVHTGITEDHLSIVGSGRIVIKHCLNIRIKQPFNLRQLTDKLKRQPFSLRINLFLRADSLAVLTELQSMSYLFRQQRSQLLHVHTDIIGTYGLVGLTFVEIVREDDTLGQRHNLLHLIHRR